MEHLPSVSDAKEGIPTSPFNREEGFNWHISWCDNGQGDCQLGLVRKISVAPSRTEKHVSLALDFADSDYNHDLHT